MEEEKIDKKKATVEVPVDFDPNEVEDDKVNTQYKMN